MLTCPKCQEDIDAAAQFKSWQDEYGEDVDLEAGDALVMIHCKNCKMGVVGMFLQASTGEDVIPGPDGKEIHIPRFEDDEDGDVPFPSDLLKDDGEEDY